MFVAAGEPGNVKKIQASVATARKVFRIMRVRLQRLLTRLPCTPQEESCSRVWLHSWCNQTTGDMHP